MLSRKMVLIKSNKMRLVCWENEFVLDLSAELHNKMRSVKTVWVQHIKRLSAGCRPHCSVPF